ncbi:protein claret segregational-like isoform X11 [Diabrotica virgifera virgifera]|uniref:Kinesin-like protein n=1 Tax=Diabrotica virgifera virgifera TaxID=50390 RepID=A0ABM5LB46_DIAVI|nr:protein claret segregational-like isoform X10 [Diabrotica virgifera virgifera]XP_050519656.1 protein claret segregational-like isoform X11 [Diabrotica virgifera virgifera]
MCKILTPSHNEFVANTLSHVRNKMDSTSKSKLPKKSKSPLQEVQQNINKPVKIPLSTPRTAGRSQSRNISANVATSSTSTTSAASNRYVSGRLTRTSKSMVGLKVNPASRRVLPESSTKSTFKEPAPSKSTYKRAATTKLETISEPKEPKQPKIAAWDFKGKYKELQEKHKKLQENLSSLEEQCKATEEIRKNFDEIIANKDTENCDLQTEIKTVKTDCATLRTLNTEITTKCNKLQEENNRLIDELRSSNNECIDLKTTNEKLRKDYLQSEIARRQLQNTVQDLKATEEIRKNFDEIIGNKDTENCDLQTEIKTVKTDYATLRTLNTEITTKCNKLQEENNRLIDELRSSNNECIDLKTTNEKLRKDYLQSEIARRQLQNTVQDLKATEEIRKNFDEIIANKDTENCDLQTEIKTVKTDCATLRTLNTEITTKCNKLQEENNRLIDELRSSNNECIDLKTTNEKLRKDYLQSEIARRQLQNTVQDLKGNIRVFCRVRPPINEAEHEKAKCYINYLNESTIEIKSTQELSQCSSKPTEQKLEFTFDQVFQESATQEEFFVELSQLVQSALDGYNVCVFAYGQTGSGKTYTMQGSEIPVHTGMIPRTINLIFDTIKDLKSCKWQYDVTASFLEIYNENVRDLLDSDSNQNLEIMYNEGRGIQVPNLKDEEIFSFADFKKYMKKAQKNRAVAATDVNQHSSRSHAVTKITIKGRNEETNATWTGSVNLVDLAGSESAKVNQGARLTETKNINKSLSALQTVMMSLHNQDKHVPYRNSKLTYLLQSSLGGNSKTLMIVNISPFQETCLESINSLRFASKVKEVKTKIKRNK